MGYDIDIPYDLPYYTVYIYIDYLLGGLEHDWIIVPIILGISSSQLTNSYFSRWLKPPSSIHIYMYDKNQQDKIGDIYIYIMWVKQ